MHFVSLSAGCCSRHAVFRQLIIPRPERDSLCGLSATLALTYRDLLLCEVEGGLLRLPEVDSYDSSRASCGKLCLRRGLKGHRANRFLGRAPRGQQFRFLGWLSPQPRHPHPQPKSTSILKSTFRMAGGGKQFSTFGLILRCTGTRRFFPGKQILLLIIAGTSCLKSFVSYRLGVILLGG